MLAHMSLVSNSRRGVIAIGRLNTSIAHALHLDVKLATLVPLAGNTTLDIHSCQAHRMIKYKSEGRFHLMINNIVVRSITFPFSARIDVQVKAN